ncbi:uncharacterized protein JCM6883_007523 [Sporobolomyces salmoneus]|uniref:uncharacterized protein n=1 Tax=Sporobolomyces salmoneus TaxID=183962 RepID=UPI0031701422
MPSDISAQLAMRRLEKLPPISLDTWHRWEEILPDVLASVTGNWSAALILKGVCEPDDEGDPDNAPPYDREKIKRICSNQKKFKRALVWDFETVYGDVKGLWQKFVSHYAPEAWGANHLGMVGEIFSMVKWKEEEEPPVVFFTRMATLRKRLNANYRAAAMRSDHDPDDPERMVYIRGALQEHFIRDTIICRLPEDYMEAILPRVEVDTTIAELQNLVTHRYRARKHISNQVEESSIKGTGPT